MHKRIDDDPSTLAAHSMTVGHPHGTITSWMGATHFKIETLENVVIETGLHVLTYNLIRVMSFRGIPAWINAMAV